MGISDLLFFLKNMKLRVLDRLGFLSIPNCLAEPPGLICPLLWCTMSAHCVWCSYTLTWAGRVLPIRSLCREFPVRNVLAQCLGCCGVHYNVDQRPVFRGSSLAFHKVYHSSLTPTAMKSDLQIIFGAITKAVKIMSWRSCSWYRVHWGKMLFIHSIEVSITNMSPNIKYTSASY